MGGPQHSDRVSLGAGRSHSYPNGRERIDCAPTRGCFGRFHELGDSFALQMTFGRSGQIRSQRSYPTKTQIRDGHHGDKHKAMSYERMEKRAAELEAEVAKWLSAGGECSPISREPQGTAAVCASGRVHEGHGRIRRSDIRADGAGKGHGAIGRSETPRCRGDTCLFGVM